MNGRINLNDLTDDIIKRNIKIKNGSAFTCDNCNKKYPFNISKYTIWFALYRVANDEYDETDYVYFEEPDRSANYTICFKCANNINTCAAIINKIIKGYYSNDNDLLSSILEDNIHSIQNKIEEFNIIKTIEKFDKTPQHIKDHVEYRIELMNNCIDSINKLKENLKVDSLLKDIFK